MSLPALRRTFLLGLIAAPLAGALAQDGVPRGNDTPASGGVAQPLRVTDLPGEPSALLVSPAANLALDEENRARSPEPTLPYEPGSPFFLEDAPREQSNDQGSKDQHGDRTPSSSQDTTRPRPQQERMFGVLPNFRSVSAGTTPPRAGWKTDFRIANRQNYDYTSIGFLLVTSSIAYGENSHPALSTVRGGDAVFWAYLWRGFVDKTDGTYQGAFLFPALLHEDTRYFAMGSGSKTRRTLHAVSSVVVAHNYDQKPVFNAAGLLGKAGAQAVSKTYYPPNSEDFGVLASKFAYSCMRQAGFAVLREFSPDLSAHLHRNTRPTTADTNP